LVSSAPAAQQALAGERRPVDARVVAVASPDSAERAVEQRTKIVAGAQAFAAVSPDSAERAVARRSADVRVFAVVSSVAAEPAASRVVERPTTSAADVRAVAVPSSADAIV